LLKNAIKFTLEGTITIGVDKDETKNWVRASFIRVKDKHHGRILYNPLCRHLQETEEESSARV